MTGADFDAGSAAYAEPPAPIMDHVTSERVVGPFTGTGTLTFFSHGPRKELRLLVPRLLAVR